MREGTHVAAQPVYEQKRLSLASVEVVDSRAADFDKASEGREGGIHAPRRACGEEDESAESAKGEQHDEGGDLEHHLPARRASTFQ
jgi:hypothetical protein